MECLLNTKDSPLYFKSSQPGECEKEMAEWVEYENPRFTLGEIIIRGGCLRPVLCQSVALMLLSGLCGSTLLYC